MTLHQTAAQLEKVISQLTAACGILKSLPDGEYSKIASQILKTKSPAKAKKVQHTPEALATLFGECRDGRLDFAEFAQALNDSKSVALAERLCDLVGVPKRKGMKVNIELLLKAVEDRSSPAATSATAVGETVAEPVAVDTLHAIYRELLFSPQLMVDEMRGRFEEIRSAAKDDLTALTSRLGYRFDGGRDAIAEQLWLKLMNGRHSQFRAELIASKSA